MTRRMPMLAALLVALLCLPAIARAAIDLVDITGRHITLDAPAERIVLGDGRHIMVMGMLEDNPVHRIVGWRQDKALDPARLAAFRAVFPQIADIAPVGAGNRQLSVESTIALMPDLVVLSLIDADDPQMQVPLMQLDAAGIPVVFVDFFSQPMQNTTQSLRILARAIGAEARAEEFAAFYEQHLARLRDRLADAAAPLRRPSVFVQVHAAADKCCATVGAGVFHDFVTAAGGHNLGADLVPGLMGNVGLENLIALDPDFYLATGGQHMRARGGLVIGAGVAQAEVDASFATLLASAGIGDLRAVRSGNAIAIWHLFNDSPMHIALIEHLAKRFHPALFADVDPAATMAEIQARFSPIDVSGVWWSDAPK